MVDWVSAIVPCNHDFPLHGDTILRVTPEGEQVWETKTAKLIEGSYSDRVSIKTHAVDHNGKPNMLYISANPVKFFQGHNIFGHNCPHELTVALVHRLCDMVPELQPSDPQLRLLEIGAYEFTRTDLNSMFQLDSRLAVNDWIKAAEFNARTRHGRPTLKGGTVYFGQHSRRWALKAYGKAEEVERAIKLAQGKPDKQHRLLPPELLTWLDGQLRIELVLRQMELKKLGYNVAANWLNNDKCAHRLYNEYLPRLQLNQNMRSENQDLSAKLPSRLLGTYTLWSDGYDLHARMTKRTFYRHRAELLPYGIDITHKPAPKEKSNVVPLVRVLEAKPATIPDWVHGTDLVYTPPKLKIAR